MLEYYIERLHWIFNYTSKKWWYCIVKTLCLVVGVPIYAVSFVVEMLLTVINMIFSWIPILNVVVMVICKLLISLFGSTFYICILPDIKQYVLLHKDVVSYEVVDEMALSEQDVEKEENPQADQEQQSTNNTEE